MSPVRAVWPLFQSFFPALLSKKVIEALGLGGAPKEKHPKGHKGHITKQPQLDGRVDAARAKELEYFGPKGVWTQRPKTEAFAKTGRQPISARWVDVNKGDGQ